MAGYVTHVLIMVLNERPIEVVHHPPEGAMKASATYAGL